MFRYFRSWRESNPITLIDKHKINSLSSRARKSSAAFFTRISMEKYRKISILATLDILLLVAVMIYYFAGLKITLPSCIYLSELGIYCAGCGGTRAFTRFMHLDFSGAAHANVLYVLLGFYMIAIFAGLNYSIFLNKSFPKWLFKTWYLYIIAAFALIFLIIRNIPVSPFTLLIP